MAITVHINKDKPAVAAVLAVDFLAGKEIDVHYQVGDSNKLVANGGVTFSLSSSICRYLARAFPNTGLYGCDILEKSEVDNWLSFAFGQLACTSNYINAVSYLDTILKPVTYIVGQKLTLADFALWEVLYLSSQWQSSVAQGKAPVNVLRYFQFLSSLKPFQNVASKFSGASVKVEKKRTNEAVIKKDEGKFVDLPGAEVGKVVVRFPPEASGYLHIGHAKAALLNTYYRDEFKGTLIMRFDDTNPAKESSEFEKVILSDLELLGVRYDVYSHTSDHFDSLLTYCEKMIHARTAYVDDTEPELMKKEREERVDSKNRNNDVKTNLALWEEMKKGTEKGQKCCVRAKLDMKSDNGCLRDPTMYRCKNETHVRTGTKYKVYPTYDFACPIVDSVENVTHALRTTEYHDRDDQYIWFLDTLGLRKPHIYEYSRLNLQNTVMSKRKLTWFVNEGIVDGWDDPRFPTVRGIIRRGMTIEGLKQFIITQGSSRAVNKMEWDKIWAYNKKVIDPVVPRYTALLKSDVVPVFISKAVLESKEIAKHPKNTDIGSKTVWYGPKVYIDGQDAAVIAEGEKVTFINWGNLKITKVKKNSNGKVESLEALLKLDDTDYKMTQKLTWLAEAADAPFIPTVCVQYSHIITKGILGKEEDFKDFINKDSKHEEVMLGDPCLATLKKGDIVQLQRRGYFICDHPYEPVSPHTGRESPCIMINIPDGHQKEKPTGGSKHKEAKETSAKEKAQSKKGKAFEKSPQEEQPPTSAQFGNAADLNNQITAQGDVVRNLKAKKSSKEEIDVAVKKLLALKSDFKTQTGKDWKPGMYFPAASSTSGADSTAASSNKAHELNQAVAAQGTKVRDLKAAKASKGDIDAEVKVLLGLKVEFKSVTGKDWKPGMDIITSKVADTGSSSADELDKKIAAQGTKVRDLKTAKAEKSVIDKEVKTLLSLKAEYKTVTGKDWKPDAKKVDTADSIAEQLTNSDAKLKQLREAKADKGQVNAEEKSFNKLKKEYKSSTGKDWKPAPTETSPGIEMAANESSAEVVALKTKIDEQGSKVRDLKASGADKGKVDAEVKTLLGLKAEYKQLTGQDVGGATGRGGKKDKANKSAEAKKSSGAGDSNQKDENKREVKKITRLGLEAKKDENLSDWYSQVITKSEMIEYYDVSGCYILRPWAFSIWEAIKDQFDTAIKAMGVENCYFPMFVSQNALEREKTHIADFAPEVAWVTKSGQSELAEPIAIRPTSETVMYPSYAKWIKSHRDLPLRLNQWCNVVRWEFKHPQPFLRTREFLWQEGHTAWADRESAEAEVFAILEEYARVYEELLAIPVVRGRKTEKEKFAGGDFTTTVEAYISASGRAIQGATSHHLGQNFSKMFDIVFDDPETQQKTHVYQNSWGITTRTIGVLAMVHGDNTGLILPPKVSSVQAVIVPCGITASMTEQESKQMYDKCTNLASTLSAARIRSKADNRDNYSPGWKFNHWELKGVPIRIELGPRDLKQNQVVAVRRDTGEKQTFSMDGLVDDLTKLMVTIQDDLYQKAKKELDAHLVVTHDWTEFCESLDRKNLIQAPFCGEIPCEEKIKKDSARDAVVEEGAPAMGAKGLCIPFQQPRELKSGTKCIGPGCSQPAKYYTMFGRSY